MPRRIESLMIAGPAGRLEALLEEPETGEPRLAMLCCHPHPQHGGTMHNKVVYRMARGSRAAGAVVLRFNYRGVNLSEGSYAEEIGETADARAALDLLRERYPSLPWALAGFSFGSRVVQRLAREVPGSQLLLVVGFPAARRDAGEYLPCASPRVFIQSTQDEHGPRPEMEAFYAGASEPKRLVWVEAADHFFAGSLDAFEAAVRESLA